MYVNDNYSRVMALDIRSGNMPTQLWRFDPSSTFHRDRGFALYENTILQANNDATRIFSLDKRSGELLWEVGLQEPVDQPNTAEMIARQSMPTAEQVYPTAGGRQILTAAIGSASPGVGWLAAYDANDGELIWRTYTIPQPGEPNFGTWPGETWRTGAAMPWGPPPAFDPETNLLYFGAGEPSPAYDPEFRAGDNLYSVSRLAVNADTGEIVWYFQEVPNDQMDGDSTAQSIIYDLPVNGQMRSVVSNWGRAGYYYTLDRASGEFVSAIRQIDNINWTAGIDPKTGKPVDYNPAAGVQDYAVQGPRRGRLAENAPLLCAVFLGGTTGAWNASYDPTTGITYNTRGEGCYYHTLVRHVDEPGVFNPLQREGLGSQAQSVDVDSALSLIAIDVASGEVVNTVTRDLGIPGGSLGMVGAMATAGGLVFTGGEDGLLLAYDKDTFDELWRFTVGMKTLGNFMSFAVDGKQYVAIITGGRSGTAEPVQAAGNTLVVFSLPD
jgi:alcohol dehydrogenase (cytochrome c)